MKVAIANRHWETAGGGETYAAAIATALARRHHVTLLSHPDVDWDRLATRLHVDTSPFDIRAIDHEDLAELTSAARDCDLFVNTTFATNFECPSPHGLLVVHFPYRVDEGLGPMGRMLSRVLVERGWFGPDRRIRYTSGWHLPERTRGRQWRWTKGAGTVELDISPGVRVPVMLRFGSARPDPVPVTVCIDGEMVATATVEAEQREALRFEVTGHDGGEPRTMVIESSTFVPRDHGIGDDSRRLGVQVDNVELGADSLWSRVRRLARRSQVVERASRLHFATTYDAVVCNSHFTKEWIRRWWGLDAEVAYPPVTPRRSDEIKSPVILSVGRFFDEDRGHSKKQFEMVQAFRTLCDGGLDGWELHLVGGCQEIDRPYLDKVKRAAEGLPVAIHVDAPAAELDELYARAAIYWQATGLGEDPHEAPEVQEHFGIAVVEAMSSGAVPLVHGTAGPAETVRHEVDGLHFASIDELVAHTRALIDDQERRNRFAASARLRADEFSVDALAERLDRVVSPLA